MKPAMLEIEDILRSTGMDEAEIEKLMCRFLEEEAFNFVECVKAARKLEQIETTPRDDDDNKNTLLH